MNYMKEVAKMLGVELNQEFKVKGFKNIYKLTDNGLEDVTYGSNIVGYNSNIVDYVLCFLLKGQAKIEKLILDKKEKEYLENFLRPFRYKVSYILKYTNVLGQNRIAIKFEDDLIHLPAFEKETMYKGMKLERYYTLKELGLFENE